MLAGKESQGFFIFIVMVVFDALAGVELTLIKEKAAHILQRRSWVGWGIEAQYAC